MPTKPKSESERAPTPRERPPKQLSIATKRSARNWCGNSKRSRSSDGTIDDTFEEEPGRGWEAREVRPDPASDAVTVIIHPGSTNLRVGLHYAYAPIVIPHCIAFRRTTRSAPHDRSDHAATLLASASLESALVPLSRQVPCLTASNPRAARARSPRITILRRLPGSSASLCGLSAGNSPHSCRRWPTRPSTILSSNQLPP